MQEIRTACLDLAIRAGATAENAIRVARDFEAYVKEPAKGPEEEFMETPLMSSTSGIDWSRPQLVRHRGDGYVVKTDGNIGELTFSGELYSGEHAIYDKGAKSHGWLRHVFVYHGEIPEPTTEID